MVLFPQLLVIAQFIAACEHRAFQQMQFVRSVSPILFERIWISSKSIYK